jgi:hypothetical protein
MTRLVQSFFLPLASATDRELAPQVQYLKEENRILRGQWPEADHCHSAGTTQAPQIRQTARTGNQRPDHDRLDPDVRPLVSAEKGTGRTPRIFADGPVIVPESLALTWRSPAVGGWLHQAS